MELHQPVTYLVLPLSCRDLLAKDMHQGLSLIILKNWHVSKHVHQLCSHKAVIEIEWVGISIKRLTRTVRIASICQKRDRKEKPLGANLTDVAETQLFQTIETLWAFHLYVASPCKGVALKRELIRLLNSFIDLKIQYLEFANQVWEKSRNAGVYYTI